MYLAANRSNLTFYYRYPAFTQLWLLGYELSDTVMVFTPDAVYFLSSKKKIEFLKQVENSKDKTGDEPAVKLLVRDRVSLMAIMPSCIWTMEWYSMRAIVVFIFS